MEKYDVNKNRYNVVSVEKIEPPKGMLGDNWHRYVIGQGTSKIEGKKTGSLKDVTEHAETLAEGFNSRMGKGSSTYVTRKKA